MSWNFLRGYPTTPTKKAPEKTHSISVKVKLGGSQNTDQIIAGFSLPCDAEINQTNFSVKPTDATREEELFIYLPHACESGFRSWDDISRTESVRIMREDGEFDSIPVSSPSYEHALRLAQQHVDEIISFMRQHDAYEICFPHDPWLRQSRPDVKEGWVISISDVDVPRLKLSPACGVGEHVMLAFVKRS